MATSTLLPPVTPLWQRCYKTLNFTALIDDPDSASPDLGSKNRYPLNDKMLAATRPQTSAKWIERMMKVGVLCGPINSIDETFT